MLRVQGKKELTEAERLNSVSEETIGRLKAEIEVMKDARRNLFYRKVVDEMTKRWS